MVVHLTNGGRTSRGMVGVFVFVLLIVFVFDRDTDMVVSFTNFQLHIFVVLGILTGLIMVISELVKRSKLYLLPELQHLSLYLLLSFSLPAAMLDTASLLPASQHKN